MPKIKEIYLWTTKVRPPVRSPSSSTVLYCPLKNNVSDATWNHSMSITTTSYWTVAKDSTWFYYFNWGYITSENRSWPNEITLSARVKRYNKHSSADGWAYFFSWHYRNGSPYHYFGIQAWTTGRWAEYTVYNGSARTYSWTALPLQTRTHVVMTYSSTSWLKAYQNGSQIGSVSTTWNITSYSWPTNIGATFAYGEQYFEWYLSEIILENTPRDATKVSDYYNRTKWNYGIS